MQAGILQGPEPDIQNNGDPNHKGQIAPMSAHSRTSWKLLTNHFSFQNKHYFSQLQFAKYYPNSTGLKNWNFTDIIGLWGLKIDGTFLFQI